MTLEGAKKAIDGFKADGMTDEDIVVVLQEMFLDDKLTIDEFNELVGFVGYEVTEEFRNMSPEEQKESLYDEYHKNSYVINFDENIKYKEIVYKNSIYEGTDESPHLILIKAQTDDGYFETENDTVLIMRDAFTGNKSLKTLVINENVNYDISFISFLKVDTLILNNDHNCFKSAYLNQIICNKIIAPKIPIYDFRFTRNYIELINGYFEMLQHDYGMTSEVNESYVKYIKNNVKKLLKHLDNEGILEYLLENDLILKDDAIDIVDTTNNLDLKDRMLKYIKEHGFERKDKTEVARKLYDQMLLVCNDINYENKLILDNNDTFFKTRNISYRKKYTNYLKKMYKNSDFFACRFKNYYITLDLNERKIETYFKDDECSEKNLKTTCGLPAVLTSEFNFFDSLTLEYGLFKKTYYNNQVVEVPDIINSQEVMMPKQMQRLFEPYFHLPVKDLFNNTYHLYFRKISKNKDMFHQLTSIQSNLLLNALNSVNSILPAFQKYENVDIEYVNRGGNAYILKDILKYISFFVSCSDRTINRRLLSNHFSEFYQRDEFRKGTKFLGFDPKEIDDLLDNYFYFQFTEGYYQGWDSCIELDDKIYFYDEKWFKMFYDSIKRNPQKNITKCSDIIPLKNEVNIYRMYLIEQKYVSFFVECAKMAESFVEFISIIKPYIIKLS